MLKFLAIAFLFFMLMLSLLGFSVIRMIKRTFFGGGGSNEKKGQQRRKASASSSEQQQKKQYHEESASNLQRKKIFTKEEGEYVDYEEVK